MYKNNIKNEAIKRLRAKTFARFFSFKTIFFFLKFPYNLANLYQHLK